MDVVGSWKDLGCVRARPPLLFGMYNRLVENKNKNKNRVSHPSATQLGRPGLIVEQIPKLVLSLVGSLRHDC